MYAPTPVNGYTEYTVLIHVYKLYTHVHVLYVYTMSCMCICVQVEPPKDSSQTKEVLSCSNMHVYMIVCLECTGMLLVLCVNLIQCMNLV